MAGTVWEWCLNKFEKPAVNLSRADDFDYRVVRGGSWGSSPAYARSAYRSLYDPGGRAVSIGFRVVCSSPSLDTDH